MTQHAQDAFKQKHVSAERFNLSGDFDSVWVFGLRCLSHILVIWLVLADEIYLSSFESKYIFVIFKMKTTQ